MIRAIINALETGEMLLAILFDFSKAFDTVDHQILLEKLEICGIREIQLQLLRRYLEHRKQ